MASNNASYPYQQRPSQDQGFQQPQQQQQGGYGPASQEYSTGTQRWAEYSASQQYEQPHQPQHSGIGLGGPINAGRGGGGGGNNTTTTRDTAIGMSASAAQGTRAEAASPTPTHGARSPEFSGYPHYTTGNTIASHVQSYAQQTPTSMADIATLSSGGSSRARTATAAQPFGYQYTTNQFGQAVTSTADIALPYRASNTRVEEYFDYAHEPTTGATGYAGIYQTTNTARTTAGSYGAVYQTTDNTRQTTAQGYSPLYQGDVRQPTVPGYEAVYQTQQAGRSGVSKTPSQTHQPQSVNTIVPTQTQSRTIRLSQTQHQPQSTQPVAPAQTQHQPRTVTPSQTQHQSSRTTTSQARQVPQTHVPASIQQPQQSQQQYDTLPPTHRTPTPTIPQRNTATPPTPTTFYRPTQSVSKSKQRTKENFVVKPWNPPGSQTGGFGAYEPQPAASYKEQKNVQATQETRLGTRGVVSQASWEGQPMGQAQKQRVGYIQQSQPQGQVQAQAVRTSQTPQTQSQPWRETYSAQAAPQLSAPAPGLQPQSQPQLQEQRHMYHRHTQPQSNHYHHTQPVASASASPVLQTQPEQEVQYPIVQPQAPAQVQTQPQPQPQPQYQQHEPKPQHPLQQPPQPQPHPQHQTPVPAQPEPPQQAPPLRASEEPRVQPPFNKDLMEQQMKIMVERMRYYQAADPATFQAVWDNVRKGAQIGPAITVGSSSNSSGGNEGQGIGDRRAIMPAGNMVRSESTTSEKTVVYTQSQTPQAPVGNTRPENSGAIGVKEVNTIQEAQQKDRQTQSRQVEKTPIAAPSIPLQQLETQNIPPPPPQSENWSSGAVQSPQTSNFSPELTTALHISTTKAISKYLIKTSGHCLPEEVILDLLHRIDSFPALCDKLESMGYKFHRGNFSRFLLAEVDQGEGADREVIVVREKEVATEVMNMDEVEKGRSRVLGEIEDDQEQIMREINEARNKELQATTSSLAPVAPVEVTIQSVKRGRGRPKKPIAPAGADVNPQQAPQSVNAMNVDVPKTPTVPVATQRTALPTPMSVVPTAPLALQGAIQPTPIFRPSIRQPLRAQPQAYAILPVNQQPPSPGLDYTPRHPTPQSVKAAHPVPSHNPEVKQFVSPSLVYRPPTPPSLIIDIDSSPSPPPVEIYSSAAVGGVERNSPPARMPAKGIFMPSDVEMDDPDAAPTNQRGRRASPQSSENAQDKGTNSPKLTKIVKLRLKSLKLLGHQTPVAGPSPPAIAFSESPATESNEGPPTASKAVMIDLTASATPEPQMNRIPQPPASAPDLRNVHDKERRNLSARSSESAPPAPPVRRSIPIPQTAPAKQGAKETIRIVLPLFATTNQMKPLKRAQYDPTTIARDIQIATGRHPNWVRPLNAHLEILRQDRRFVLENPDLETVRWDIIDPGPVGSAVGYDAGVDDDDDDDDGFNGMGDDGGVDVAMARAPVMFSNPAAMKGMIDQAVAPSPTPAARGRGRSRGGRQSILGASVLSFQNSEHGITNMSNGAESTDERRQRTPANSGNNTNGSRTNGNSLATTGRGSWGGFSAPAPRSSSRTGNRLRNVVSPDAGNGNGNFAVIIRSPSVSSIDRNKGPESTNSKGLKRKLNDSEKEKGTPATKKPTKPAKAKPSAKSADEEEAKTLPHPPGFKVFKCRWKFCFAELHNYETLHRHVIKAHRKLANYGGYPCHWEGCSRSPTKEMKKLAASNRGPGKVVAPRIAWDFNTPEQWETHVIQSHLESVKNEIGVGPSVGPFDHEVIVSDIDYLSDSFGRQITPVARLAPFGHVFLPPPGYESSSPNSALIRHVQRARALGAGMEGDETADLRENDDGQGIRANVRRIVLAEDGAGGLYGGGLGGGTSESMKEKARGKGKGKQNGSLLENLGRGSNEAGPSNGGGIPKGGFTVYDDEEYTL